MQTSEIRLYGRTVGGNDSWARVTAGMAEGLRANGVLAGVFDTSAELAASEDSMGSEAEAAVAVAVGPIATFSVMLARGLHQERLGLIAANSTWLPGNLMRNIGEYVTGLIGPSVWSCRVIEAHAPEVPVYLWHHGVSGAFRPIPGAQPEGSFSALHLSSSNKERKGTDKLIDAWGKCKREGWLPKGALLTVVTDAPAGWNADSRYNVLFPGRLNLGEEEMSALYQRHHVLVQPSRAEGFGMCPVEARASGVPIVATDCTGHRDHVVAADNGVVVVPTGELAQIDDGPGAMAPSLEADALAHALRVAYDHRKALRKRALDCAEDFWSSWTWPETTKRFLESLRVLVPWNKPGVEPASTLPLKGIARRSVVVKR